MLSDDVMGFLLRKSHLLFTSKKYQETCINQCFYNLNNYVMSFFCVALVISRSLFEYCVGMHLIDGHQSFY